MKKCRYYIVKISGDYDDCYKLYEKLHDTFDEYLWEMYDTEGKEYADYWLVYHIYDDLERIAKLEKKIADTVSKLEYQIDFQLVEFVDTDEIEVDMKVC